MDTFPWLCSSEKILAMICAVLQYRLETIGLLCRGCLIGANLFSVIQKHFLGCRMPPIPHKAMQQADSHGHIYLALQ